MADRPVILAFDCAGPHCAVAVASGAGILAERYEPMAKGQAERLMPLIEAALDAAQIPLPAVTTIAVGIGPGNFTGIRIAVAAARGLSLALGCPAIGISTLEALAHCAPKPVLAVQPARREQVYVQQFHSAEEADRPAVISVDALDKMLANMPAVVTPVDAAPLRLGPGAVQAPQNLALPMAEIAAKRRLPDAAPRPAPLYLRAPDAAPARDAGPVILP